jgi:rare lipoprotein A
LLLTTLLIAATFFVPTVADSQTAAVHHANAATKSATRVGYASYYSSYFNGRKTASGERFSNAKYTAASKELPLGARVRVTNLQNHRSVVVRVTDRGPYVKGRAIDLSQRAAADLGILRVGVAMVNITPLT